MNEKLIREFIIASNEKEFMRVAQEDYIEEEMPLCIQFWGAEEQEGHEQQQCIYEFE